MAASSPTCARSIPAAANTSGNSPQAIPSFRLLTSPAWLTLDRFASSNVVRQKTSRAWARPRAAASEQRRFVGDMVTGFADEECRQRESDDDESDAEIERLRPKTVPRGNPTGRKRAGGQRHVARELVQAHRQSALLRRRRGRSS